MTEKKYKIRPLAGKDIFKISKFIKKLGVNRLQEVFGNSELSKSINNIVSHGEKQDIAEVGKIISAFIAIVIDSLCDVEEELNELLKSVSNLSKEEISELPFKEYIGMVKDLFMQKDFMDFFGHIRGQFTKVQTEGKTD